MTEARKCAEEFAKWVTKNNLQTDLSVYVDGKRYHVDEKGNLIYDIDADPRDYVEYAGDFMTVTTEGPLYNILNDYDDFLLPGATEELDNLFKKYDKYYDMCYSWALSLFNR